MPTFILKKYNTEQPQKKAQGEEAEEDAAKDPFPKEPEAQFKIRATGAVSAVVALALYKSMPRTVTVEEVLEERGSEEAKEAALNVISTEDVNLNPVDTLRLAPSSQGEIVVLGQGFHTQRDEWFLSTLNTRGVKAMVTMESFMSHVRQKLGV